MLQQDGWRIRLRIRLCPELNSWLNWCAGGNWQKDKNSGTKMAADAATFFQLASDLSQG